LPPSPRPEAWPPPCHARSPGAVLTNFDPSVFMSPRTNALLVRRISSAIWLRITVAAALGCALGGCAPKIGRQCSSSTDCSSNGDRLCDTTQPNGYCTIFNCEPDSCPSGESVCVAFSEPSCPNLRSSIRFDRTFCMATCGSNDDCRSGYVCENMGVQVVDSNPPTHSVCIVAASSPATPPDLDAGVCQPGNVPIETTPPEASAEQDAATEGGPDAGDDSSALDGAAE